MEYIPDPNCLICKGTGKIGSYYHAIDDNDIEPCECIFNEEGKKND
jgi:hypothetical protein